MLKKVICFFIIFFMLFFSIQDVLQAKWNNDYNRVHDFYELKTAPEVVFIGSSHIYCSINPLLLFHEFGLVGHNFSSAGQELSGNLLYVKEAIRIVKPKVIILDVLGIADVDVSKSMSESNHRKCVDPLPLTINKLEQVHYAVKNNEQYDSFLSYIFPLIRYHDRWNELSANDFNNSSDEYLRRFYGYSPRYKTIEADFSKYNSSMDINEDELDELKEFLYEIVQVCEENNTELLLIKTPSPLWRQEAHEITKEWAYENGVPFVDYNYLMDELDIKTTTDFSDVTSHLNDIGATKLTMHLGKYLNENYNLTDYRNNDNYEDYEIGWDLYQQDRLAYFLSKENQWNDYIKCLKNSDYSIYITVKDNIGGAKQPKLTAKLTELGLSKDVINKGVWGYQAIIKSGDVYYENLADEPLYYKAELDGNKIEMVSEGYKKGNHGSIKINGIEYFVNHRGVGIVVYDTVLDKVVDSVTFDLWDGGKAYRN